VTPGRPCCLGESATPHNYLEKVFQVAFWLKDHTGETTKQMLQALVPRDHDWLVFVFRQIAPICRRRPIPRSTRHVSHGRHDLIGDAVRTVSNSNREIK
jgi:hypothetical protein